jgi:Flp pilus assembly protein TadD
MQEAWQARDYEPVIPLLEETLEADPRDWNARDKLASALVSVGRLPEAATQILALADFYERGGFYAIARAKFRIAQKLSPDNPEIATRLAALEGKGQ